MRAEIGAFLHDIGKATTSFVQSQARNSNVYFQHADLQTFLSQPLIDLINGIKITVCNETCNLLDIISTHHKRNLRIVPQIVQLILASRSGFDGIDSGVDKGNLPDRKDDINIQNRCKQAPNQTSIATAFGFELPLQTDNDLQRESDALFQRLQDIVTAHQTNPQELRDQIHKSIQPFYKKFWGETRRPANDVTLWDHSYSVATMFKCAIARNILDCSNATFDPLEFDWQVLAVTLDVLGLLGKGVKLGDILGYKKSVKQVFKKCKQIVEVEYPIGNEIYRDSSGMFFLVADKDLQEYINHLTIELRKVDPELMLLVHCKRNQTPIPTNLTDRANRSNFEAIRKNEFIRVFKEISLDSLKEIQYPSSSERFAFSEFHDDWGGKEVCPVCRLRPKFPWSEACDACMDRRVRRAHEWLKKPQGSTIWLDEIADHNDRIAMIVGSFDLQGWVDGTYIQTLAIREDGNENKNAAPARIRRCWETTRNFIKSTILGDVVGGFYIRIGPPAGNLRLTRILFKIEPPPRGVQPGEARDIEVEIDDTSTRLSPVCIDARVGLFSTTINLEILKHLGKNAIKIIRKLNNASASVERDRNFRQNGASMEGGFHIQIAGPEDSSTQTYLPYFRVFDSPDQFLILVPATDALDLVASIFERYQTQFSKVRDRLPLHLGVVGFHRKTTLPVILNAGKALLGEFRNGFRSSGATRPVQAEIVPNDEGSDGDLGTYRELTLEMPNYSPVPVKWRFSLSTGDPSVPDKWYPYLRVADVRGRTPNLSFQDQSGNATHALLVTELQPNDKIQIDPAFFTLSYIENATDRLEISQDPRPVDDICRLSRLWGHISRRLRDKVWTTTQLHAYWREVELRRHEWGINNAWTNFVRDSIINMLGISTTQDPELFEEVLQATSDNLLGLCLFWHLQVRKYKPINGMKD